MSVTIEQSDVIDILGLDVQSNKLHLTIADHLQWGDENEGEHLALLQSKLNTYLGFIENGEYLDVLPDAEGYPIRIVVIGRFELNERARNYYSYASKEISNAGFELVFEHSVFSEDLH